MPKVPVRRRMGVARNVTSVNAYNVRFIISCDTAQRGAASAEVRHRMTRCWRLCNNPSHLSPCFTPSALSPSPNSPCTTTSVNRLSGDLLQSAQQRRHLLHPVPPQVHPVRQVANLPTKIAQPVRYLAQWGLPRGREQRLTAGKAI
jgi:hypothetical protein